MSLKMLKCAAIDDEPLALELIKEYCSRIPYINLLQTFEDAIAGGEYLSKGLIDLLFVDINMPDITGLELVKSLQIKPLIIFTTAYRDFAFEGFELEAVDYLLKPIEFDRFLKATEKARHLLQSAKRQEISEDSIFIHSEYKLVKIILSDIEYIESLHDYVRIHLRGQKPVLSLMPLKKILDKLPPSRFRRIHRSYIISTASIKALGAKKVILNSLVELPIGESFSSSMADLLRL